MTLQLVVNEDVAPGIRKEYLPGVKQWRERNGYVLDNGRHQNYIHWPTQREMQLYCYFNPNNLSYALEIVSEASYIEDMVVLKLDLKLTGKRFPASYYVKEDTLNLL